MIGKEKRTIEKWGRLSKVMHYDAKLRLTGGDGDQHNKNKQYEKSSPKRATMD